ncbi:diacylglycerol kinase epsilon [Caerostris darwini]|uniref:Diacylglycerol kinase n=1 Tax=Caerostris darwini TaxID=1538125 RepID=A0AAV4V1W6_9ARAC|nr:diacylglycerol kinase epsilon [Caerostris darwini]
MKIKFRRKRNMWNPLNWYTIEEQSAALVQGGFLCTFFFLSIFMFYKVFKKVQKYELPARDISKGHKWCSIEAFPNTAYCSICSTLIIDGYFCDSCGVCADRSCYKKADKTLQCKALASSDCSMKHHWIKGNLPFACSCDVCEADCGAEAGLSDFHCCWCQRMVHKNCLGKMSETCDFGRYRSFIVPPSCVTLKKVGLKGRRHLVVQEVQLPPYRPWSPLIVIGNRKSGNNEGEAVLRAFRSYLNPAQVIDLHEVKPEKGLQWCKLISSQVCRILVAGGDGTVGWVLNAIDTLNIEPAPQVCILPLGTGNDLSRVLGWGHCYSGELEVRKVLDQISAAVVTKLDRWKIKIAPTRHIPITHPVKEFFMNNYVSVGVDALVALNFHKTRESKFYVFSSRLINRCLYAMYGAKDIIERGCENLHEKMELYLDGKRMQLPALEAVIILNISSWGGGVNAWNMGTPEKKFSAQKCDDGLLEVMGVYSSFHIAQLQIGMSEPVRLGQARSVKLKLLDRVPIQIDGEPWEQSPAEVTISFHGQATFLCNKR